MYTNACRQTILVVLAFLIVNVPSPVACGSSLREEAVGYRAQGYEAQRRGDRDEARSFYQKAAALDPTYATPHNDIGVLLEEDGRLADAEQAYRQALTLSPNSLEAQANLAMLYERMGDKERAIYHWLKRYQLGDPHDPWTNRAEERLVALGVLTTYPGMKGKLFSRRRLADQEFRSHAQSLEEFQAVTETHGDWP